MMPGNHDAVRLAEPQPALPEQAADSEPPSDDVREAATTHFRQAITHYRSGEFKKALAELRGALRCDPEHEQAAKVIA